MRHADIKAYCLSLPGATANVQWGADLVFKIGGKMFAVMGMDEAHAAGLSFKAAEDSFHILTRQKGIIPAPYLARAHWVRLENPNVLNARELKAYLARAHALIASGLPKKTQATLGLNQKEAKKPKPRSSARRRRR